MWKHIELIVTAALSAGYGIHLLESVQPPTTSNTYIASAFVVFALWLMAKVQLQEFGNQCVTWCRGLRRGGDAA